VRSTSRWYPPFPSSLINRMPYTRSMPDRSSKKQPRDVNQLAASIVDEATSEEPEPVEPTSDVAPEKNAAAVALGRLGGLKGGNARAAKLSPEERSDIAKRAAAKRWGKSNYKD